MAKTTNSTKETKTAKAASSTKKTAPKTPETVNPTPVIVTDGIAKTATEPSVAAKNGCFYSKLLDIGIEESFAESISSKKFEAADEVNILNLFTACVKANELFTADELSKVTHMLKCAEVPKRAIAVKTLIKAVDPDFSTATVSPGVLIMASIACKIIRDANKDEILKARGDFLKEKAAKDGATSETKFSQITKDVLNLPKAQQQVLLTLLKNVTK